MVAFETVRTTSSHSAGQHSGVAWSDVHVKPEQMGGKPEETSWKPEETSWKPANNERKSTTLADMTNTDPTGQPPGKHLRDNLRRKPVPEPYTRAFNDLAFRVGPTALISLARESMTLDDAARLRGHGTWDAVLEKELAVNPKWSHAVRETLDQKHRYMARVPNGMIVDRATPLEQKVLHKVQMRGAVKGLAAAGGVLVANEIIDRTLFGGVERGPMSDVSDIAWPGIAFIRIPWALKVPLMVSTHCAGRIVDMGIPPEYHGMVRKLF